MGRKKNRIETSIGDKIFDTFNAIFMILVCFATIYPFINTLAISFNDGIDAMRGRIYLWSREFTLRNYEQVLSDSTILNAYFITISRTVIGVLSTIIFTGILAYGLSKKDLVGRKVYLLICIIAMIFNPGLIPTYMLYMDLGLLNNFLVYILPNMVNVWYMILMKTYFEGLPGELEESAKIDGCNTVQVFAKIVIPLSMPIIATICIFSGVFHWNSWFDAYMYVREVKLHPIQTYLYRIIALSQAQAEDAAQSQLLERMRTNVVTLRAATVMITTVPIVCIYAIFQKHFIKGVMIGALKG